MPLTNHEPAGLTEIIEAYEGNTPEWQDLPTHRLADMLHHAPWLLPEIQRSVDRDVDALLRLREGPFAEEVGLELASAGPPYSFYAGRLTAVLDAAEAARHGKRERAAESAECLARAFAGWSGPEGEDDPIARAQVMDLVALLLNGEWRAPQQASMSVPVPVRGREGVQAVTLVAEIVDGHEPAAWPCPRTMAFTEVDPATAGELAAAVIAQQAAGPPDRPFGVRWRLVAAHGATVDVLPGALLTVPFALLVRSLIEQVPLDPSMTVVAGAGPGGSLVAVEGAAELAGFAQRSGKRVVVPGEGDRRPRVRRVLGGRGDLSAPDVASALRLIEKHDPRLLRWSTALALSAVLTAAALYGLHVGDDSGADAEAAEGTRLARGLAEQVRERGAAEPERSLLRALTAQRVSPGGVGARSALMTSVYGDLRLRGLLRGAPRQPHALVMARDGRTVAATGDSAEVAVWTLGTPTQAAPRKISTSGKVTALALTADGATLALADPASGVRTVALSSAGRAGVHSLPETGTTVNALTFSPDGTALAAATTTGGLLWRTPGDKDPDRLAPDAEVTALAFGPKGRSLAQTGPEGKVTFWTWKDGRGVERSAESDLGASGTDVMLAPDGKTAYALARAMQLHLLDASTGKRVRAPVMLPRGRLVNVTGDALWLAGDNALIELDTHGLRSGKVSSGLLNPPVASGMGLAGVSGDGSMSVTTAVDGSLAVHGPPTSQRIFRLHPAGVFRMVPLTGTGRTFSLMALMGSNAALVVLDENRGTATAFARYPSKYSLSPGDFSPRTRSAALVTSDGFVRVWRYDGDRKLEQLAELQPPAGSSGRPYAAFDEQHGRLVVAWGARLVSYAYDGTGPPTEVAGSTLAGPLGCMTLDPPRGRIIGCTRRGLEMWPLGADGKAGRAVSLGSRPSVKAVAAPDGTVVGLRASGELTAYDVDGSRVKERPLPGHRLYVTTMAVTGNDLVTASRDGHVNIVDVGSGELLLHARYPDISELPFTAWSGAGRIHLALGFSGRRLDLITDPAALAAHACRLGGWSGPTPTVGDVAPKAPERVRAEPLCPAKG